MRILPVVFLSVVVLGSAWAQTDISGLVAHFPLDNHLRDVSGGQHDGKSVSELIKGADRFGNPCGAVYFNGKGQVVSLDNLWVGNVFTVTAWFKPDKLARNESQLILLSQEADISAEAGNLLNVKYTQAFYDARSFVTFSTSQNAEDKTYQSHRLDIDSWFHFSLSSDGEWVYAYINGKLISQLLITRTLKSNGRPLLIGREAVNPAFYQGFLDDVRVYNRSLTPLEISSLAGRGGDNSTGQGFNIGQQPDLKLQSEKGKCAAKAEFALPVVNLSCGKYTLSQFAGLPSGSFFGVGKTINRYRATDDQGTSVEMEFAVEVSDIESPSISCPSDIYVKAPAAARVMPVNYGNLQSADNCKVKTLEKLKGLNSGAYFPVGKTEIQFQASDSAGNVSTCSFNVIVEQLPPPAPIVSNPSVPTAETDAPKTPATIQIENSTVKTQPIPSPSSNAKAPGPVSSGSSTGTKTPTAQGSGVMVSDVKPKSSNQVEVFGDGSQAKSKIIFPSDMTKPSEPGKCGAVVNFKAPKTENGKEVNLQQAKGMKSGSFFPVGATENSYYSYDQSGSTEYFFNVVVLDEEKPVLLNCPTDTVVKIPYGRRGETFYYKDPDVKDNCKVDSIAVIKGSKSGCFLPLGAHPFVLEAKDAGGNFTQCAFEVVVIEDETPSVVTAPQKLAKHLNLGNDSVNYEHRVDVNNCFLTILIYDDGEEDNDSVSIIYNGNVIVDRDMIRLKENGAIKRELVLGNNMQNYLIAKAWNTGRYGSNTLKIDVFEGSFSNDKRDIKNKKPVISKILHSRPGIAGGLLLNCQ